MMSNSSNAQINPECPNGWVMGYKGCYCHQFYWLLSEHDWKDDVSID